MQTVNTLTLDDLIKALEPVVRRIIKEELDLVATRQDNIVHLAPNSDLHRDMLELKERKENGTLNFLSHKEVWGEHVPTSGPHDAAYAMN